MHRICHILILRCTKVLDGSNQPQPFSYNDKEVMVKNVIEPMASEGLRTLSVAYRDFPPGEEIPWEEEHSIVSNLTMLCIVGIEDPVRPEVCIILML